MSDIDLDRLDALAAAATPGPWQEDGPWWSNHVSGWVITTGADRNAVAYQPLGWDRLPTSAADAAFIAAARDAVPALVAEVRRLREENAGLKNSVRAWADTYGE